MTHDEKTTRVPAREINDTIRYTGFVVFQKTGAISESANAGELINLEQEWAKAEITLRGAYDVSVLRGDANLMLWLHAATAEALQSAIHSFERTAFAKSFKSVFSAVGLHRPAEFNKSHVPAFMSGAEPKDWLCFYPFVRSYEWYLLPDEDRKAMLFEHGMAGRNFKGILSNTVASFALGDYEWLLALESNDLHEIVDMMRELRSTQARLHVREETPFYTGKRIPLDQLVVNFS